MLKASNKRGEEERQLIAKVLNDKGRGRKISLACGIQFLTDGQ